MNELLEKLKELALSGVLPALKSLGKAELVHLFDSIGAEEKGDDFANEIKGTYFLLKRLQTVAEKSKTKIDDGVVSLFMDAVTAEAEKSNIALT